MQFWYHTALGLSFSSFLAEICLQLAKRIGNGDDRKRRLLAEGIKYSSLVEAKMKDKSGNVVKPLVYARHSAIDAGLHRMNLMVNYEETTAE